MSENLWLAPPIVFLILLGAIVLLSALLTKVEFRPKSLPKGFAKAYSSGEDMPSHMIQPDYSQFFPFAFYFTILHVVALMATTVPIGNLGTYIIAFVYIAGAGVGLSVLYRK
jgi:ABC-type phosphate/phosphonate transport system permease subunit